MLKKLILTAVMCGIAVAGEVQNLIQFKPNTTAKSSEVNQNFNTIKDAVNDNNQRIGNLESFRDNLKGNCPSGQVMKGVDNNGNPVCEQVQPNEVAKRTHIITIPATACVPENSSSIYEFKDTGTSLYLYIPYSSTALRTLRVYCPVIVPAGAVITEVKFYYFDMLDITGNDDYIGIWLKAGSNTVASYSSPEDGTSGLPIQSEETINVNHQVNAETSYYVEVYISNDDEFNLAGVGSPGLRYYKTVIYYEY